MKIEFFIAKRFLSGQRFGIFRFVTTVIAISGTALGVAALLITLAVLDGFRADIEEKILGTQPHVFVVNPLGTLLPNDATMPQRLVTMPHVQAASPFIYGQALMQSGSSVTGIMLRAIVPTYEVNVTRIANILSEGSWNNLDNHSVILGRELARTMSAHIGQDVVLVAPQQQGSEHTFVPRMRQYKVAGIFHSGMYEYDANLVYLTIPAAQDLLGLGDGITGYSVRLDHVDNSPQAVRAMQEALGSVFWVRSWQDLNRNLFSAMKLERTMMFIIVTLIILVSSFTIISNLLLLTIEKANEIGILQAIGASPRQVGKIFLWNGFILGGTGVSLGMLLGLEICFFLKHYSIIKLPADVYYIDKLPIRLTATTVESVAVCAFALVLGAILYPAWKASQMDPVHAIRHG